MVYAADGFASVVGMDDSRHEGEPCVHGDGEDTCIVGGSPLVHPAGCDAVLVRVAADKDTLHLVNGDGTLGALGELHKQEVEEGEVDQKLLGCKDQLASVQAAMIAG